LVPSGGIIIRLIMFSFLTVHQHSVARHHMPTAPLTVLYTRLSVCRSETCVLVFAKATWPIITQSTLHSSLGSLVFWRQEPSWYSNRITATRADNGTMGHGSWLKWAQQIWMGYVGHGSVPVTQWPMGYRSRGSRFPLLMDQMGHRDPLSAVPQVAPNRGT